MNAHLSEGDREEVLETLRREVKIAALSVLRQKTGADLREAMKIIDSLAQTHPVGGNESEGSRRSRRAELPPSLADEDRAEVKGALGRRGKVEALALLRRKAGIDLITAEEVVGSLQRAEERPVPPTELLDLAVGFVLGSGGSDTAGKSRDFDHVAGRWDQAQREEALRRAQALYERAFALCDRRRGYRAFLTESRSMCPGFSEGSYRKMWGRAMTDTR